ncbi:fumarylacetoacetate hydrolase family protein [Herbidospora sp. NBRC 101105]|uniref:fumarylacetoacetate hydrolase family protein n=1 Tax=Herbidospora sp. NBRC 101105 TaxID=3032195 RepID=UPI002555A5B1|nr:fumarylacetoacetate hydrolase family protein [Herbidospora sp. NBRC 101105]
MRLLRVGGKGAERPAVLTDDERLLDLGEFLNGADFTPDFFASGGLDRVRAALAGDPLPELDQDGLRIGPPIARPGKIVCIGLNYRDHAEESGAAVPTEPVVFMKAPNTVVGPFDEVLVPRASVKTDWEVELAIVIGSTCRYLGSHEEALAAVAGYTVSNDVSEREFQLERGGQWDKGKSCETFQPLGPWLVTADEVADPQALGLRLWVNGDLKQNGDTKNMIFGVAEIVRYLSQFMVLEPGDVINTGTPAGVALSGLHPYLKEGDVMELEIDGLGRQRQTVGQA